MCRDRPSVPTAVRNTKIQIQPQSIRALRIHIDAEMIPDYAALDNHAHSAPDVGMQMHIGTRIRRKTNVK